MVALRYILIFTIIVGGALSVNARLMAHAPVNLAEIVAQHQAEVEDHGHSHEDTVDVSHAYHGHAHDAVDHDHNTAFLTLRRNPNNPFPDRLNWPVTQVLALDSRVFGLDRPPRS